LASDVNEVKSSTTILLVDDDVEVLKALTKVLEKGGYGVLPYSDAQTAMDSINRTKQSFDLVVTDVSMPKVNGGTFLGAIKTAFPKVPVIIITAFGDWGQYMDMLQDGAYEYLSKPLEKNQLLAVISRALANGARLGNSRPTMQQ
jgi:two-component system nitrogen regulation response regulator GlnG